MINTKKFPHYKQLDAKDCGPTCLKIIAKYFTITNFNNKKPGQLTGFFIVAGAGPVVEQTCDLQLKDFEPDQFVISLYKKESLTATADQASYFVALCFTIAVKAVGSCTAISESIFRLSSTFVFFSALINRL